MERLPDSPIHKEKLISQLFGEVIGYLKSQNLTKGVEFETKIEEVFQCSKRFIWVDELSETHGMTIYFNSISCTVEYGVYEKKGESKNVTHRMKLENLRYKISDGTEVELIDAHQTLFNQLFEDFQNEFKKLKK